jgi:predicted deacylase
MTKPADTGPDLTRREFALGAGGALGALAVGGVDVVAQADDTSDQTAELGAFDVPAGAKQFAYHTVMNNDAIRMEMPVGVVSGSAEGPTLIVTGGLFATEYSGVEAASRMYRDFDPETVTGRVIIIPVITMDAFRFRTPMFGLNAGSW